MAEVGSITAEHDDAVEAPSERNGEDALPYESDSDQDTSALGLRRRVASDDEDEDNQTSSARREDYYEEHLVNHEGGPPIEEDEEEDDEEEEEEYEDADNEGILMAGGMEAPLDYDNEEAIEDISVQEGVDTGNTQSNVAMGGTIGAASEGKKDAEPFVVPTAGAFYMHDDRFRYNGLARPRRSAGGRKLWEAKDEKPWVHDRFEELNLHDEGYPVQGGRGRHSRGRQGRVLGSRNNGEHTRRKGFRDRNFEGTMRSKRHPLGRGRGLRRAKMDEYEFRESRVVTSKILPPLLNEETSSISTTRLLQNSITKTQDAVPKKPTINSILNVSSPPFFPTGTALHTLSGMGASTSKVSEEKVERELSHGRPTNISQRAMEQEMKGFSTNSMMRLTSNSEVNSGSAFVSNNGDVEAVLHRSFVKGSTTLHQLTKPGSGPISQQQQRVLRSEMSIHTEDQPLPLSSKGAPHLLRVQPVPASSQQTGRAAPYGTQSMLLQPVQQPHQMQSMSQTVISSGQAVNSPSLVLFPGKPVVDLKNTPAQFGGSSGNGTSGRGTLSPTVQAGRGSVLYGSSSLTSGLRGVVQFAGQSQGGLGVPSVGVALPGYSRQPQFNFPNNSEVTWIPILASGGSSYSTPYMSVDNVSSSTYYTQQTSQVSNFSLSLGDSNNTKTVAAPLKASHRTESDDLGQQRRRYSQMTFGEERR